MASHSSPRLKRERSGSTNQLLFKSDDAASVTDPYIHLPAEKSKPTPYAEMAAPLQHLNVGETKRDFFSRLSQKIDHSMFKIAHAFDKGDGIYIYKRPVRSASPQHAALLAQAGTIFNHVVVYLKRPNQELVALEFNPSDGMDVTQSLLDEAPAAPVLKTSPEHPEPGHLPMLYVNSNHHALDAEHIQHALNFAAGKNYQVMHNNCIAFADFICRSLTGNKVKNAPLIFDYLVGKVPEQDSPLLPLLQMMTQLSWFHVADGSRLMYEFLEKHGAHVIVPLEQRENGDCQGGIVETERKEAGEEEEEAAAGDARQVVVTDTDTAADSTWSADTKAVDLIPYGSNTGSSASSGKKKEGKLLGPKLPRRHVLNGKSYIKR